MNTKPRVRFSNHRQNQAENSHVNEDRHYQREYPPQIPTQESNQTLSRVLTMQKLYLEFLAHLICCFALNIDPGTMESQVLNFDDFESVISTFNCKITIVAKLTNSDI